MDGRLVIRKGLSTIAATETVEVHSAQQCLHLRPGLSDFSTELYQLHYAVLVDGLDPAITANDFQASSAIYLRHCFHFVQSRVEREACLLSQACTGPDLT
jgi:hypothetical protein